MTRGDLKSRAHEMSAALERMQREGFSDGAADEKRVAEALQTLATNVIEIYAVLADLIDAVGEEA